MDVYEEFIKKICEEIKKIDGIEELRIEHIDMQTLLHSNDKVILSFFDKTKDSFTFYFKNCEDMAYIVGIGLNHAKVILKGGKISIIEISEEDWEHSWRSVESGSSANMKLLKLGLSLSLDAIEGRSYLGYEVSRKRPLLWELAKYFTLQELITTLLTRDMHVNYVGASNSNSHASDVGASSSKSNNHQGESSSAGGSFEWKPPVQKRHGDDEDSEGQGGEKKKTSNHHHEHGDNRATTVSVKFLAGGDCEDMVDCMKPCIAPRLKFTFSTKDDIKRIHIVVGSIRFRLICDGAESEPSWYHEDLSIRFGLFGEWKNYG